MIPFPLLHGHVMHPRASRRTTVQESKADFRAAYRAAPEADPARSALFDVLFAETVEAAAKAPADAAARYTQIEDSVRRVPRSHRLAAAVAVRLANG